jgi:branched-chain amino acid transport system ATP-binding protein
MLDIKGLDVYYGPVQALRGLSLHVGEGEMVALLGSNGAGKTTTLRAASGMRRPKRGAITIDGQDATNLEPFEVVRLGVAHMPQGRELFAEMTVLENLRLGHWSRRTEKRKLDERTERVFDLFPKLRERAKQHAGTLSGGEQQMLTVSRALMSEPKVLLVDEASLGLAPIVTEQLYEVIAEVNRRDGTAVLLVDQFIHLALRYTQRAYVLEKGQVILEGESDKLAESPDVLAAYLGESAPPSSDGSFGGNGNGQVTDIAQFVANADVDEVLDAVAAGRVDPQDVIAAEEAATSRVAVLLPLRAILADRAAEAAVLPQSSDPAR